LLYLSGLGINYKIPVLNVVLIELHVVQIGWRSSGPTIILFCFIKKSSAMTAWMLC